MIVAGFGFRASAAGASLLAALSEAQRGHPPVQALATPIDKLPALAALATALGLPLIGIESADLRVAPTFSRSPYSLALRRTGSVAEASALVAAGPRARLLAIRRISPDRMATCAIAEGYSA